MKELISIKQKRFADNLIDAGFTRREVAKALQLEFGISARHATVLVYRWYVGDKYKVSRSEKIKRQAYLPFSKASIRRVQDGEFSGKGLENDKN